MRRIGLLLLILPVCLPGCNSEKQMAAGRNLAKVSSKSAATMAAYYESLTEIVSRQPTLEVFYQSINPNQPKLYQADFDLLDQQRAALQRRTQLATSLKGFYDALQRVSTSKTGNNVTKAVDNLINSLTAIAKEPPGLFGANQSGTLNPVISSITDWKKSRGSKQALEAIQITLNGLERLVNSEKNAYNRLVLIRYFTLLNGNSEQTGIAKYLVDSHSTSVNFLLQQFPELKALPWNTTTVQDTVINSAMHSILTNHISLLELKAKTSAQNVADLLQELVIEHQKLIDGRPLSLTPALSYQQQVQDYLNLWDKFKVQK